MEVRIRSMRTLKVTDVKVSDEERQQLASLRDDGRYQVLLDTLERICIEIETSHLNTSFGEPEAILGGHALARAAWLVFTYLQKQVENAYLSRTALPEEPIEEPTFEEILQGVE